MGIEQAESSATAMISIAVDTTLIGKDALLKTCYWFSRDFSHELDSQSDRHILVRLFPKEGTSVNAIRHCQEEFLNTAIDFELRTQIEAKTSSFRELILAKAFAASGVFEDEPDGILQDSVGQANPSELFNILDS